MIDKIPEQQIDNSVPRKSARDIIVVIFQFVKKHKQPFSITALVFAVLFALFSFIPSFTINNVELVNLGATVRITESKTVKLKFDNMLVKIERFIDDACPKPGTCYGPDKVQGVAYSLQINNKVYLTDSFSKTPSAGYRIQTISSDYKTYTEIKIVKADEN